MGYVILRSDKTGYGIEKSVICAKELMYTGYLAPKLTALGIPRLPLSRF